MGIVYDNVEKTANRGVPEHAINDPEKAYFAGKEGTNPQGKGGYKPIPTILEPTSTVAVKHTKLDAPLGTVVEMTLTEKAAADAQELADSKVAAKARCTDKARETYLKNIDITGSPEATQLALDIAAVDAALTVAEVEAI